MWPTPAAGQADRKARPLAPSEKTLDHGVMLCAAVYDSLQENPLRMWPTVRANDAKKSAYQYSGGDHSKPILTLNGAVRLLPTPQAFDSKHVPNGNEEERKKKGGCRNLSQEMVFDNGFVNPEWIEWLMGLPIGWTELKPSETQ